jgi:hypothetical protein
MVAGVRQEHAGRTDCRRAQAFRNFPLRLRHRLYREHFLLEPAARLGAGRKGVGVAEAVFDGLRSQARKLR